MKQYVIFLDVDGTMIAGDGTVATRDIEALRLAQQKGHLVFINTGRPSGNWPHEIDDIPLDGACMGCGSYITLKGNVIFEQWMPKQLVRDLVLCARETGMNLILEGETGVVQINCPENTPFGYFEPMEDDFLDRPIAKYAKLCVTGMIPARAETLLSTYFTMIDHETYLEAVPNGTDKGKAVRLVMEALNLPMENSIAMGDSLNDLDMLNVAGIAIAMGNACDELKMAADYVTASVSEGGIAQALEKYVF